MLKADKKQAPEQTDENLARLHFFGAAKIVSGSNCLLEVRGLKILIDCGMFQGPKKMEEKNHESFPYNPAEIDFLLVTHAHFDHIGRIPKLVKDGFKGIIYATSPTVDVTKIMLEDSQRLLEEGSLEDGARLFEQADIKSIMTLFSPAEYGQKIELSKDVLCFFRDAGHILGSAMIEVWVRKKPKQGEFTKIVFSGDIGNPDIPFPLLNKPTLFSQVDYVVMESTYGDRDHASGPEIKNLLEDIIENTISQQGVLMVPTSALERTQQILYHLNELAENKRIPYVPIYVDSPLAIHLTDLYQTYSSFLNEEAKKLIGSGEAIFRFPGLSYTISAKESKMINHVPPPKIIIAGSSTSQGGRIIHHEARYLSDANSTLLVVTYQAAGTRGRQILDGAKEIKILDQVVAIQAKIESISGYSDHIDQAGLLTWVSNFRKSVKGIFIVHGEEKSCLALKQMIMDGLGILPKVPNLDEVVEIDYTK